MPDFSHLLGYQDLGEAVFAQTQRLDDVNTLYPSYGNAQQGKFAQLEIAVEALRRVATTSGVAISVSQNVELTADYRGVLTPGQLPFNLVVDVKLLGLDVLSDPRTEIQYEPSGLVGSETAPGIWTVTAVTALDAQLKVIVDFAAVEQGQYLIEVTVVKAAAPPVLQPDPVPPTTPAPTPTPGPAPSPEPTPAQSVQLDTVRQKGTYALIGSAPVLGGFTYQLSLSSSFNTVVARETVSNIEVYLATRAGTATWQQLGAAVLGDPTTVDSFDKFGDSDLSNSTGGAVIRPGYIEISREAVLPSGNHAIGLFAKLEYGEAVNLTSLLIIEPGDT